MTRANARRLLGVDSRAAALGLAPGMMLTEARALVPELVAVEADEAGDRSALDGLALWCRRWSPTSAVHAPDAVLIDITGAAHLLGGEEALIDDALSRLAAMGFTARAAIADLAPAALALTRAHRRFISAPGRAGDDLAPLPVQALDLPPDMLARLAVMGLRRIGDLARFGRAKLRPRLGAEALARLDMVLGWRAAPLAPLAEPVPLRVQQRFAEPLERLCDVEAILEVLAPELERALEKQGKGARRLALTLYGVDGHARRLTADAAAPLRQAARVTRLLRDRLARFETGLDHGFGFDLITLEALVAEPLAARQTGIAGTGSLDASDTAALIDRLTGRLGVKAVRRLEPASSHVPERAVLFVPAVHADGRADWGDEPWASDRWSAAADAPLARPLALLPAPEPIEVVAEVPDGPPVRFTWRRLARRVTAADGPERIAGEWWRESAPTRDYYRVEDEDGARFWIYRAGLYERETGRPRWYMHGLFP